MFPYSCKPGSQKLDFFSLEAERYSCCNNTLICSKFCVVLASIPQTSSWSFQICASWGADKDFISFPIALAATVFPAQSHGFSLLLGIGYWMHPETQCGFSAGLGLLDSIQEYVFGEPWAGLPGLTSPLPTGHSMGRSHSITGQKITDKKRSEASKRLPFIPTYKAEINYKNRTEGFSWKRLLRSLSPTVNLTLTHPALNHVPKCQRSFTYSWGWQLHHFPEKPVSELDKLLD